MNVKQFIGNVYNKTLMDEYFVIFSKWKDELTLDFAHNI